LLFLAVVLLLATGPVAARTEEPTIEPANYPALRWQFETRDQIFVAPVIAGNIVLQLSEDGYLYALDIATGAERWRAETGHDLIETDSVESTYVTADDDTAYISDTRGRLRAIDVATGETLWRRQTAPPQAEDFSYSPVFPPPTVVDGVVYVDDIVKNNGVVYALDAATGEELWEVETAPMESFPLPVVDGVVFVTDINGDLWFIDAATGEPRARYRSGESLVAAPVVGEGMAFLALKGGRIDAIQPDSGERQWSAQLPSETENVEFPFIVSIADGVLFVRFTGQLLALDASNGQILWELETYNDPTVGDSIVYVADVNDRLIAVDVLSGATLWRGPTGRGSYTVAGDTLYASVDGSLIALDAKTGLARWRVRIGDEMMFNSVTVTDDAIFLGSTDQFLYALTIQNQTLPPEGFAGNPISATPESLVTVQLEPLPEAPAFVGIWSVTVPGNASGTIPALNGPAAGYLQSGSLDFPDGVPPAEPDGYFRVDSADQGETIRLPLKTPLAVENPEENAGEFLVIAVLPEDRLPETGEQQGVTVDLVGGDKVATLPGDGAFVDLGRLRLDPGAALVPTLSAWTDLVVVESGSLDLAVESNPSSAAGRNQSEASTTTTIAAGDDAVLPASTLRFARAGEEPTSLLLLAVSGNIHTGQGGGCGGRCIQTGG
jgi:outer membrane protein assembly factor BamB